MTSLKAGDVVTGVFSGAVESKARPTVVLSSAIYHANRLDILIGFLTTQVAGANAPTDYTLTARKAAGLTQPSAFRAFLATVRPAEVTKIGRLSDADWKQVQARMRLAVEIQTGEANYEAEHRGGH